jgi:hypothetical protein
MQLAGAPTDSVGGPFGPVDHFTKLAAPMISNSEIYSLFFPAHAYFWGLTESPETDAAVTFSSNICLISNKY